MTEWVSTASALNPITPTWQTANSKHFIPIVNALSNTLNLCLKKHRFDAFTHTTRYGFPSRFHLLRTSLSTSKFHSVKKCIGKQLTILAGLRRHRYNCASEYCRFKRRICPAQPRSLNRLGDCSTMNACRSCLIIVASTNRLSQGVHEWGAY